MGGTAPANQLRLSFTGSEDGEAETETCRVAKPLRRTLNRRMRARMSWWCGRESGRPLPLCRFVIGFDSLKFFFEFERLNRIEPERTHAPQSLTYRACTCRTASEEGCEEQFMLPFASWPFQPKSRKRSAPPSVRLFMDSPRTRRWPPTLPRAVTACAHSSRAKTAEFSLLMIASPAPNRFHSPARSMFTRRLVRVTRRTPDFRRSFAGARVRSRPTHAAAAFWPRNTWRMGNSSRPSKNCSPIPTSTIYRSTAPRRAVSPSALSVLPINERCQGGFRESPPFLNLRPLPHFASLHHRFAVGPALGVSSQSPVKRLQTNHLGSTLGRAHPSQVLCQSFRTAGPISAIAGSQGSGGGGTPCQPITRP